MHLLFVLLIVELESKRSLHIKQTLRASQIGDIFYATFFTNLNYCKFPYLMLIHIFLSFSCHSCFWAFFNDTLGMMIFCSLRNDTTLTHDFTIFGAMLKIHFANDLSKHFVDVCAMFGTGLYKWTVPDLSQSLKKVNK